jgi:hypothetical protein
MRYLWFYGILVIIVALLMGCLTSGITDTSKPVVTTTTVKKTVTTILTPKITYTARSAAPTWTYESSTAVKSSPIVVKAVTTGVPASVSGMTGTPAIPVYPRPSTGTLISGSLILGGEGVLTIDNTKGGYDAVAILTYTGRTEPLSGVFIQKGESYTFRGIRDGVYDLYFILGNNWNPGIKKFMNHPMYERFTDNFDFSTTSTQYTIYRVTLYGVVSGNADTRNVEESNFPKL